MTADTQKTTKSGKKTTDFSSLLSKDEYVSIPQVGDVVKGKVISLARNEVKLDIEGVNIGVVRGRELFSESEEYGDLSIGDEVEATVIEQENENGEIEMSFRQAGHRRAWDELFRLMNEKEITTVKITEANNGGLICRLKGVLGFLPVSQLAPGHYPRVQGGDKVKILEKLRKFVNKEFDVKVIDVDEKEEKLIVSEKAAWEETERNLIDSLNVGDVVDGKITAVTDFGAFVAFGKNLEGLVHISEIAWQRIENPQDILKVGDHVKVKIIKIEGSKIFLSIKALIEDPWQNIDKKYKIGQVVKGRVLKVNPFGLFVELDKDIHGLAHISELSDEKNIDPDKIAKPGDVMDFKIVSIQKSDHRLGLSLRRLKKEVTPEEKTSSSKDKESALKESEEEELKNSDESVEERSNVKKSSEEKSD